MKKITLLVLVIITTLFVSCALVKDSTDVEVELVGNATTGYQWSCSIDDETIVELGGEEYVVPENKNGMVGVGGTWVFSLSPVSDGETEITFRYARSWERTPIDIKIYSATVSGGVLTLKEK